MPALQFAAHSVLSLPSPGPAVNQIAEMMEVKIETPLKKGEEVRGIIGYNCLQWQGNCELS